MRKVRLSRLLATATLATSGLIGVAPAMAQPRPLVTVSKFCSTARQEFPTQSLNLRLDETATPLAAGVAAIDELRFSLLRVGGTAPGEIAPVYRSSVGTLGALRSTWKTLKTSRNETRKSNARISFSNSSASFAALSNALVGHMTGTCTGAPSTTVPPTTTPPTTRPTTIPPAPVTLPTIPQPPVTLPTIPQPPVTLPTIPQPPVTLPTIPPAPVTLPTIPQPPVTLPTIPQPPVTLPTIPQPPVTLPTIPQAPVSGNASAWLAMINQARSQPRSCGGTSFGAGAPLSWDARLEEAARVQSSYQQQIGTMTHTGAGGSSAGQRMTAAGFAWSCWAENVGWNYPGAAEMMQGWMNSPGHCANIMGPELTHVGWARVGAYDTMVLGRQR